MKLLNLSIDDLCLDLAIKMEDPEHLISTSLKPQNFIPQMNTYPWIPTSLSHGCPGQMIFFSELYHSTQDKRWERACNAYLLLLLKELQANGFRNSSLFGGLTGICFSLHLLGPSTSKLLLKFHPLLLEKIEKDYLEKEPTFPFSPSLFDHIAGISGVLSYLLNHLHDPKTYDLAKKLVSILIQVAKPKGGLPGWYHSPKYYFRDTERQIFPSGFLDTGLAHGVSGCLAALSKAAINGLIIPEQQEAMIVMIEWLKSMRQDISTKTQVWPAKIGLKENFDYEVPHPEYFDGWCYGAPGISLSLFLASHALKDSSLYVYAVDIMKSVCHRYHQNPNIRCISFCHGLSGLMTMIYQMHLATKEELFLQTAEAIAKALLDRYDQSLPFGFKSHATSREYPDLLIDNPGLLDGSTGVGLSLLLITQKQQRSWMEIFAIK